MKAELTIDGIRITVETTDDNDISFWLPDHMGDDIRLSLASTHLLTATLMAAVDDIEEDD